MGPTGNVRRDNIIDMLTNFSVKLDINTSVPKYGSVLVGSFKVGLIQFDWDIDESFPLHNLRLSSWENFIESSEIIVINNPRLITIKDEIIAPSRIMMGARAAEKVAELRKENYELLKG